MAWRFPFAKRSTTVPAQADHVVIFVNNSGVLCTIDDEGTVEAVGDGSGIPQGGPLTSNLDANGKDILDAATVQASAILPASGELTVFTAGGDIGTDGGNVDVDGGKVIGLGTPSANTDADTKGARNTAIASASVRTAAGVPVGAPVAGEVPFAYNSTAVTGGFYYWNSVAWIKVAGII